VILSICWRDHALVRGRISAPIDAASEGYAAFGVSVATKSVIDPDRSVTPAGLNQI
jgi:hypothetical protein